MPHATLQAAMGALLRLLLPFLAGLVPPASALHGTRLSVKGRSDVLEKLRQYSFNDFVREFGRSYMPRTEEWQHRERVFYQRMQEVIDFHSGPARSWSMGVTRFMDFTESEFNAILGYRGRRSESPSSLLSFKQHGRQEPLPKSVNTRARGTKLASLIRDQGACGSCWAEAATSVLEARMEANQTMTRMLMAQVQSEGWKVTRPTLSSQTVVSCSPNPRHCGGNGGCGGATVELAYDMIKERGLPLAVVWPYQSGTGITPRCNEAVFRQVVVGITGYTVLPSNKLEPLKRALYESGGPIAITAAASGWAYYDNGIFTDEKGDFTVNHAVTLVGYQEPRKHEMGYWVVKNSWGDSWGEKGYIRIEMKVNEEEHCGWDYNPKEGVACDGDPEKAWVCGTCGVLYDSTYPNGVYLRSA
mmetsp:Transcript_10506/g.29201  ORF Transcript_10506/g.29201 Transcript_10506/m.29201 type:complete len:415 (-) Transcript_10506:155-1399(-)|eukprot:CAMPEP_0179014762 /NCGR_PEP_ID=MMETSP0796-20121207/2428_1 /TAXON_ID=73915 /ORGANISM="Pyrodinium bahamense, Strain pbaha01" /LENGTH=414 /DNA_ID=CAMNT_0020710345 /DNA_START=56 /DNA_END=1300 /DNA_ORIENTATION=-